VQAFSYRGRGEHSTVPGENGKCYAVWDPSSHFSPSLSPAFSPPQATLILFTFRSKNVLSIGQGAGLMSSWSLCCGDVSKWQGLYIKCLSRPRHCLSSMYKMDWYSSIITEKVFAIRVAAAVWSSSFLWGVAQRKFVVVVDFSTSCTYEGWNFNSGNYLFTTDTN